MCKHDKTIATANPFKVMCLNCEKQWDESQLEDLENERYLVNYYLGL